MPPAFRLIGVMLLATVGAQAAATPPGVPASPEALAQAVQQHYDTVRDFSADFEHTYRGGVLRTAVVERGTAVFKKPGLMRWVYLTPERKEFVSDGHRIYVYIPEDRQVIVSQMPADTAAPLPVLFLAGKGDIRRDFVVSLPEASTARSATLAMRPRSSGADYAQMLLTVELPALRVTGLTTVDLQGGTSAFTFTHLKENQGLSDKQFAFRIPKGVDVLTDDGSR